VRVREFVASGLRTGFPAKTKLCDFLEIEVESVLLEKPTNHLSARKITTGWVERNYFPTPERDI
jgi:hypothetical protein